MTTRSRAAMNSQATYEKEPAAQPALETSAPTPTPIPTPLPPAAPTDPQANATMQEVAQSLRAMQELPLRQVPSATPNIQATQPSVQNSSIPQTPFAFSLIPPANPVLPLPEELA
ncbi:classical arabinogalactan protein 9-like [Magnolia sinica]|uniref:classical arabinogalactan protein 9-like n=1 Tax=Magnolia sinica TaxID=86752 RepID=UPI002659E8A0|nr:classical arabinogalactan protein 9-like [Magnolia sinica]